MIAAVWHRFWLRLRDRAPQLRLALRVTSAAILAFLLSQLLTVPLAGLWAVLTSVVVTQMSVGSSVKAAVEYGVGTLGGAIFAGAVATLVPHTSEAGLLLVLALAVAPMALLAALKPHFRVAPFTAVLVVLGSTATHIGPIGSAAYRVLEVGLGGLAGLAVSLLILPARAHTLVIETAAAMLDLLARSLPQLFAGFTRGLDAVEIAQIQGDLANAYTRIENAVGEAKREQMTYLAAEPDPGPLLRALRRLRHDFIIIGRAATVPLPPEFQQSLGPPLAGVAKTAVAYLQACGIALTARRGPPALTDVQQALDAYAAVIATARREGTLRPLSAEAVERIYALGFALDHLQENFNDLKRCVGEFAQPRQTEAAKPE
jgi:uncharacterized membrane protein YccC